MGSASASSPLPWGVVVDNECGSRARLRSAVTAGYNICVRVFARPIAWAYGRLLFTRRVRRRCYLPVSMATNFFDGALTIEVDPRRISHRVPYAFRETQRDIKPRFVWQGDWDVDAEVLDDDPRFIDMRELVAHDDTYRTTQAYRRMLAAAEAGSPEWRQQVTLRSAQEIDDYFESKARLLAALRSMGYKSQAQLSQSGDEIGIAIGRHGELLKYYHGHHRIALAKLLEVDRITVSVGMVHHLWVQECCLKYGGDPVAAVRRGLASLAD